MPSIEEIERELCGWLEPRLADGEPPAPESDLLESGRLDSMLMMDLSVHLETQYGVRLEPTDFSPGHFRTVSSMARLVADRQSVGCS